MSDDTCIRIWTPHTLPTALRPVFNAHDRPDSEPVVAVVHVPSRIMADPLYQEVSGDSPYRWLGDPVETGCLAPFGANAITVVAHPDGDGHLILLSCV